MMRRWLAYLVMSVAVLALLTIPVAAQHGQEEAHGDSHAVVSESHDGHETAVVQHDEHGEVAVSHGDEDAEEQGEEDNGGGEVMMYLSHHLLDSPNYDIFGYSIALPMIAGNFSFIGPAYAEGFQITRHMIGFTIAALLVLLLVVSSMGRTRRGEVPKGLGNFFEVLIVFIRDEVVYANIGKEHGRKWLPFFLTLFFLILFANLLGMVPWGVSATGNVNFTAGLAIVNLIAVVVAGIAAHGFKYIGTFIPNGVPIAIWPILFPIEIFGLFVKHFALTIRLFANMLAGHTVIGVFLALIAMPIIALASVPGAAMISILELFVAFLQAYVFVMLGSIFVGSSIHAH
ncbi:ATP synthase subunit a [bacterium BMS3Bbin04]|nr:ATP synthase subunit a [bacterium BMS3Bbin04]